MTTIAVFGSSSILALFIVALKWLSVRRNKEGFLLTLLGRFNPFTERLIVDIKFRLLQIIQTIRYIFTIHIPVFIDKIVEKARQSAIKELEARRGMLLGRKDIANKGSVSFFLKKIDENKQNTEKGEINDSL